MSTSCSLGRARLLAEHQTAVLDVGPSACKPSTQDHERSSLTHSAGYFMVISGLMLERVAITDIKLRNRAFPAILAGALSLGLASCSGGTPSTPAASASTKTSTTPTTTVGSPAPIGSQPSSGPDAVASVKANWTAFFDPTTPIAQRILLLQDGAKFKGYLEVQAQPGSAHLTTEQVTAVTLAEAQAIVTYNILIRGVTSSALTNQSGQAIFSSGTWQVSDADFCSLLSLENNGKTLAGC